MRFAFILLLTLATTAGAAEITLREEASISVGTLLRLGDVATITGDEADRLALLPLMPVPSPGTRQFVSAASVRAMLAAQGESAAAHRFAGAYRVLVATPALASEPIVEEAWKSASRPAQDKLSKPSNSTAFRVIPRASRPKAFATRRPSPRSQNAVREAVAEAIQQAIDNRNDLGAPRIAVTGVQLSETALRELAEMSEQSITAEFLAAQPPAAGSITVRVWPEARVGGEAFNVIANLVERSMRVVVERPIARGSLVTASAVRLEPVPVREINRPQAIGYQTLKEVVGREAKRPLRPGQVLSDANTALPLMVRRNEEVEVISGGGGVTVRLTALAKQDGRQGELITVQLLDRKEEFTARVVGHRQLAVLSARSGLAGISGTGGLR